ncbi:MAG: hypothetical protein DMG26_02770 [Acidobacteria bacterium]|nr:MAG: hypothetical protein DMG26_02770 [Acidobacteriota bacterium]
MPRRRRKLIYLLGFMGSGKSTVGALLARELGWPFIDLDATIEAARGQTVREIFEREGEEAERSCSSPTWSSSARRAARRSGSTARSRNCCAAAKASTTARCFATLPVSLNCSSSACPSTSWRSIASQPRSAPRKKWSGKSCAWPFSRSWIRKSKFELRNSKLEISKPEIRNWKPKPSKCAGRCCCTLAARANTWPAQFNGLRASSFEFPVSSFEFRVSSIIHGLSPAS